MDGASDEAFETVVGLGQLLRSGKLSSVELTEFYLERLDSIGRDLNAVVTLTAERAMNEARRADAELRAGHNRGPLHGIPYGVKDIIAAGGYPTTWGAPPFRDQVFDADARVIEQLANAGAVLVAKLATIELAGCFGEETPEATFTGPTPIPWSRDHWAGSSSTGSACATAAGLVGFSIASETMGSIVFPAANCGVSGLRPSHGLVDLAGAMTLSWTLDKLGPLARSAKDCRLVQAALASKSSPETFMPVSQSTDSDRRLLLGVWQDAADGAEPSVQEAFDASLSHLASVADIETVQLPDLPYREIFYTILHVELAVGFEEFVRSRRYLELNAPLEDPERLHAMLDISGVSYARALQARGEIQEQLDRLVEPFDAILAPTRLTVAPRLDASPGAGQPASERPPIDHAANLAGLPGLTIPNGYDGQGLPTALGLIGRHGTEARLLEIAEWIQHRTDWHLRRPQLER